MRKLVRDKLPEIDPTMKVHLAHESERAEWLLAKLDEEVQEVFLAETDAELLEELADVWEAFRSLVYACDTDVARVLKVARDKRKLKGGFDKLVIWDDGEW